MGVRDAIAAIHGEARRLLDDAAHLDVTTTVGGARFLETRLVLHGDVDQFADERADLEVVAAHACAMESARSFVSIRRDLLGAVIAPRVVPESAAPPSDAPGPPDDPMGADAPRASSAEGDLAVAHNVSARLARLDVEFGDGPPARDSDPVADAAATELAADVQTIQGGEAFRHILALDEARFEVAAGAEADAPTMGGLRRAWAAVRAFFVDLRTILLGQRASIAGGAAVFDLRWTGDLDIAFAAAPQRSIRDVVRAEVRKVLSRVSTSVRILSGALRVVFSVVRATASGPGAVLEIVRLLKALYREIADGDREAG